MNHKPTFEPIAGAAANRGYRPAIDLTRSA
jgi:hypothetical protein